MPHEGPCKILSAKGNPQIATILRVLQVLGIELVAQPAKAKRSAATRKGGIGAHR